MIRFDKTKTAIINPSDIHKEMLDFPKTVISVFSHDLFAKLVDFFDAEMIATTKDADGIWPVYKVKYKDKVFGLYKAKVGAPSCVGNFEDIIAMGAKRIILLGNCGVLDRNIEDCGIIIPNAAIRDEGTSFKYIEGDDTIKVNRRFTPEFKEVCKDFGYNYIEGITWTTDGFYRETKDRVEQAKEMGAICVEMECAAIQALCEFRNIEFFQYFYAGDNLDHSSWDPRSLSGTSRLDDKEKIALLAFELGYRVYD